MEKCVMPDGQPNDPKWETVEGLDAEIYVREGIAPVPAIGIGGYECKGCGDGNVCLAMFVSNLHSEIRMTPDAAREFAAELMKAIARADPKGAN
jgi:hypothetical protein